MFSRKSVAKPLLVQAPAALAGGAPASPVKSPQQQQGEFSTVQGTQRGAKYDDVCLFKVNLTYDEIKDVKKLDKFLAQGGDVNYCPSVLGIYDWTLLHWAAYYQNIPCIKLILQKGADAKLQNADRETPFKVAQSMEAGNDVLKLLS